MPSKLLPLNSAQSWLLSYFESPYEWYDRMLFTIEDEIDVSCVQKALDYLILRHDGLRMSFIFKDKWHQRFRDDFLFVAPHLISAETMDDEDFRKKRDDYCLKLCKQFDITNGPLFKLVIFKKGDKKHDFMFLFHHIIIDYFSCLVFFREFYQIYASLLENKTPNLPECTTHLSYSRKIESSQKESWKSFWDNKFQNQRKNTIRPIHETYSRTIEQMIPASQGDVILRKGKQRMKTKSLHFLLAAPLYKAIFHEIGEEDIVLSHKLHGRHFDDDSSQFLSTIGNFAINVPIKTHLTPGISFEKVISELENEFSSYPLKGLSYDLSHTINYPDHILTPFRFNFLGNVSFTPPPKVVIPFNEMARRVPNPTQPLTTFAEFFVHFLEKSLHISVQFDASHLEEKKMKALLDLYVSYINELIILLEGI